MGFSDKQITCVDCGQEFTFTADEQEFFQTKGYTNEPKRCLPCRQARKGERGGNGGAEQVNAEIPGDLCSMRKRNRSSLRAQTGSAGLLQHLLQYD